MRNRRWFVAIGAVVFCLVAACGYAQGLTNIRGWSYKEAFFDSGPGNEGRADGADLDGEVGHPFQLNGPCASTSGDFPCYFGRGSSAIDLPANNVWVYDFEVVSGTLPPGLSINKDKVPEPDSGYGDIVGIPTQRGHWIVKVRLFNIKAKGEYYKSFTQELRFHITGTGQVIQ